MKYLPLVWAGLWRKRVRTVLTLLCVVVAFALFGLLHGFTAAIDGIIEQMSDTRLRTMSRVNITQPLPLAHRARMQAVPGVEEVSYYNFFAGYYQDRSNGVQVGAIDVASFNVVYPGHPDGAAIRRRDAAHAQRRARRRGPRGRARLEDR